MTTPDGTCWPSISTTFKLLNLNVQCLRNKVALLELLTANEYVDFLCLEEHWLETDEMYSLWLQGFAVAGAFCRRLGGHGGVAILLQG